MLPPRSLRIRAVERDVLRELDPEGPVLDLRRRPRPRAVAGRVVADTRARLQPPDITRAGTPGPQGGAALSRPPRRDGCVLPVQSRDQRRRASLAGGDRVPSARDQAAARRPPP